MPWIKLLLIKLLLLLVIIVKLTLESLVWIFRRHELFCRVEVVIINPMWKKYRRWIIIHSFLKDNYSALSPGIMLLFQLGHVISAEQQNTFIHLPINLQNNCRTFHFLFLCSNLKKTKLLYTRQLFSVKKYFFKLYHLCKVKQSGFIKQAIWFALWYYLLGWATNFGLFLS